MEQQDGGTRAPDEKCTILQPLAGPACGVPYKGKFGFHDKQQENVTKRTKLCFFFFFLNLSLDLQCFYLLFNITPSKENKVKVLM